MSEIARNPLKAALRKKIEARISALSKEEVAKQSEQITEKVLASAAFQHSQRISVYLSTDNEVSTLALLSEIFRQNKKAFVPSYKGKQMTMLQLNGLEDYQNLPLTKWNIKQPKDDGTRESAVETGGLDLILLPGVAFTKQGGRVGHGMGYYDKFIADMFVKNPGKEGLPIRGNIAKKLQEKKSILFGLALKEQITDEVPLEPTDYLLDDVITAD